MKRRAAELGAALERRLARDLPQVDVLAARAHALGAEDAAAAEATLVRHHHVDVVEERPRPARVARLRKKEYVGGLEGQVAQLPAEVARLRELHTARRGEDS